MKKILSLVMVLAMVLALAACGGSSAPAPTATPAPSATEAAPAATEAADVPAGLEDGDFSGHLAYCAVMWRLLRHMFSHEQTMDGLVETARLYSSEIEYSDENVEAVLDVIDRQLRKGMV